MGSARILRAYRHIPVAVLLSSPFPKGEDEGEGFFFSVGWSGRTMFQFLTFLFSSNLVVPSVALRVRLSPKGESEGEETPSQVTLNTVDKYRLMRTLPATLLNHGLG